jgi:hypothetical protein
MHEAIGQGITLFYVNDPAHLDSLFEAQDLDTLLNDTTVRQAIQTNFTSRTIPTPPSP